MKKLTLILFLAITKIGFAQQDTTIIYSSTMYSKDPVKSKWRPVTKRNGEFYQVTFYDRKDVIQETINFEDKDFRVRKGPYLGYQKGLLKGKGNYEKGHKHGEWIGYYTGEQIYKKENFVYGKLEGKWIQYWTNQQVQQEGQYTNNKKSGKWLLFYEDGELAAEEIYDDETGKKIDATYYDQSGKEVSYKDLFASASYSGGMEAFYKYLSQEIKYPAYSAKNKIGGTVKLSFVVTKTGGIENVEIIESPNDELAREAIRVLKNSKGWQPGKMFGKIVNVKYRIPIKFSL